MQRFFSAWVRAKIHNLGNMSNPLINRWGLNLFWYKVWYIDKDQFLFFNQDELIERLVFLYLHFGVLHASNLFFNKYWYQNVNLVLIHRSNLKYYRAVEYKNKLLNISYFYNVRIPVKNIHVTKLWLLRYQNWLVLNFYCFQLLKKRILSKNWIKQSKNLYTSQNVFDFTKIKRIKLLFFFMLNSNLIKKNYYSF